MRGLLYFLGFFSLLSVVLGHGNKLTEKIYLELSRGNVYQAERLVYDVLDKDPHNIDALFAKSILIVKYAESSTDSKLKNQRYSKAMEILDSLNKKLNGFYYYHFIRAKVLENLGAVQEAIKEYDNSIFHNPKFVDSYISKSWLFWKMGNIYESYKVLWPIKDKYRAKMLIGWYKYQESDYSEAMKNFNEIIANPIQFKSIKENREVLNQLYFQIMWVNYRANRNDLYWIKQNLKYNTNNYYYVVSSVIYDLVVKRDDELAVKQCLYNISRYPDKPYLFFIMYNILKKHDRQGSKNYLMFLRKSVELDIYNLDFRRVLDKEA